MEKILLIFLMTTISVLAGPTLDIQYSGENPMLTKDGLTMGKASNFPEGRYILGITQSLDKELKARIPKSIIAKGGSVILLMEFRDRQKVTIKVIGDSEISGSVQASTSAVLSDIYGFSESMRRDYPDGFKLNIKVNLNTVTTNASTTTQN